MEEKNIKDAVTAEDFLELLLRSQQNDKDAMLKLLKYFEDDMVKLSKYIRMPQEDALQSMKLELIHLFKNANFFEN